MTREQTQENHATAYQEHNAHSNYQQTPNKNETSEPLTLDAVKGMFDEFSKRQHDEMNKIVHTAIGKRLGKSNDGKAQEQKAKGSEVEDPKEGSASSAEDSKKENEGAGKKQSALDPAVAAKLSEMTEALTATQEQLKADREELIKANLSSRLDDVSKDQLLPGAEKLIKREFLQHAELDLKNKTAKFVVSDKDYGGDLETAFKDWLKLDSNKGYRKPADNFHVRSSAKKRAPSVAGHPGAGSNDFVDEMWDDFKFDI